MHVCACFIFTTIDKKQSREKKYMHIIRNKQEYIEK